MRPLLMMRTRGLNGPFFGEHAGNRASHPLAKSIGNAHFEGHTGMVATPDVIGQDEATAIATIEGAGLVANRAGVEIIGVVNLQQPIPGVVVFIGTTTNYHLNGV